MVTTITEAEGLAELGLWEDAWFALDALSTAERETPAALRVRLACCPPMGGWEIGRHIVELLRDGGEAERIVAAGFYLALARKWFSEGDPYAAKQAVAAAVETWPDHRRVLLEDPELAEALL